LWLVLVGSSAKWSFPENLQGGAIEDEPVFEKGLVVDEGSKLDLGLDENDTVEAGGGINTKEGEFGGDIVPPGFSDLDSTVPVDQFAPEGFY